MKYLQVNIVEPRGPLPVLNQEQMKTVRRRRNRRRHDFHSHPINIASDTNVRFKYIIALKIEYAPLRDPVETDSQQSLPVEI